MYLQPTARKVGLVTNQVHIVEQCCTPINDCNTAMGDHFVMWLKPATNLAGLCLYNLCVLLVHVYGGVMPTMSM